MSSANPAFTPTELDDAVIGPGLEFAGPPALVVVVSRRIRGGLAATDRHPARRLAAVTAWTQRRRALGLLLPSLVPFIQSGLTMVGKARCTHGRAGDGHEAGELERRWAVEPAAACVGDVWQLARNRAGVGGCGSGDGARAAPMGRPRTAARGCRFKTASGGERGPGWHRRWGAGCVASVGS